MAVQIGIEEYEKALCAVLPMLPGHASDEVVRHAAENYEVDIYGLVDEFRVSVASEVIELIPLFAKLIANADEDAAHRVISSLVELKLIALVAGVRAGRMFPDTPFQP